MTNSEIVTANQARVDDSGARLVRKFSNKQKNVRLLKGQIKALQTSATPKTVTVEWNAEGVNTLRVRYLSSYTPALNDRVIGITQGREVGIVLGKLA